MALQIAMRSSLVCYTLIPACLKKMEDDMPYSAQLHQLQVKTVGVMNSR